MFAKQQQQKNKLNVQRKTIHHLHFIIVLYAFNIGTFQKKKVTKKMLIIFFLFGKE